MKRRENLHIKQIPTTKYVIEREIRFRGWSAMIALVYALLCEADGREQAARVAKAAAVFERISCLVYVRKDGSVHKPERKTYYERLFGTWAEEEINAYGLTAEKAAHVRKLVEQIAELVCPMMACADKQLFDFQYEYAIEYVIRHGGALPKPEIRHVFPTNYPDYQWIEDNTVSASDDGDG